MQRAETLDAGGTLVAEDGVHLIHAELVMARGYRGVRREDAGLSNGLRIRLRCVAKGSTVQPGLEQADGQQGGVALVHVADLRLTAKRVQQMNATKTEDGLLAEPVVRVAAVEVVGESAIVGVVALDVGVQQEDGDDMAGTADDIKSPGANGDFAALHLDADRSTRFWEHDLRRPEDVGLSLLARGVEVLLEITVAMHERDCDQGSAGVGCRTQRIAGEHAETARVGG